MFGGNSSEHLNNYVLIDMTADYYSTQEVIFTVESEHGQEAIFTLKPNVFRLLRSKSMKQKSLLKSTESYDYAFQQVE